MASGVQTNQGMVPLTFSEGASKALKSTQSPPPYSIPTTPNGAVYTISLQLQQPVLVNEQQPSYLLMLELVKRVPSWECVLIETIISLLCCWVLGLIGIIFAVLAKVDNNNPRYLKYAHYLGFCGIAIGCVVIILGTVTYVLVLMLYAISNSYF